MKIVLPVVLSVLVLVGLCFVGCGSGDSQTTSPPPATQPAANVDVPLNADDVAFFAKTGIVLALNKASVPVEKLTDVRQYVEAARLLIVVPNRPDFDGARRLAAEKLPEGSRVIGLAVVDIVERYVPRMLKPVDARQASYQQLAAAALDGVVKGIDQYQATTR